jgi:hypothetical protein
MDRLGDMFSDVIRSMAASPAGVEAAAIGVWRAVVGSGLARVSRVLQLDGDQLVVEVISAQWRDEIASHRSQIADRLNARLGDAFIRDLSFRVVPRLELPAAESEPVVPVFDPAVAACVRDQGLRAQFVAAAQRCLARRASMRTD